MDSNHKQRRNDPCQCGSGLKYKKCCLLTDRSDSNGFRPMPGSGQPTPIFSGLNTPPPEQYKQEFEVEGPDNEINKSINDAMSNQQFHSLDEAQAFANQFMEKRNSTGLKEFHGFSPAQMHQVLNAPYQSPTLVTFNTEIRVDKTIPYVRFFESLLAHVGTGNFKPTATGNLPRNFCRSVALAYWGEERYAHETRFGNINSEPDFHALHTFRLICEMVGYLRKYRGKFIIGKECQVILKRGGLSALYLGLFKAFVQEYNWAFGDRYEPLDMIQRSWLFSLYLLQQHGDDWKPTDFYEDAIINAFPLLLNEIEDCEYTTAEQVIKRCYRWRVLQHWMVWFGLAEVENLEGYSPLSENFRIRKRPIADSIVTFHDIGEFKNT